MAKKEEVNAPLIVTTGIVSVLMLIVTAVGTEAWFRYEEEEVLAEKWAANKNTWLMEIHDAERKNISTYRWIDKKKQTIAIPVDAAMRVIAENQGKMPSARAN